MIKVTLTMRASNDPEYASWLLRVGSGSHDNIIKLPQRSVTQESIIESTFGSNSHDFEADLIQNKYILAPTNDLTLKLDEGIWDRVSGHLKKCYSADTALDDKVSEVNFNHINPTEAASYSAEFLDSLTPTGLPPNCLRLKVGCIVILLRNLAPNGGPCNGTRMIIQQLGSGVICCSPFMKPDEVHFSKDQIFHLEHR